MLKEDVDALLPMKKKFERSILKSEKTNEQGLDHLLSDAEVVKTIGADEYWFLRNFFQVTAELSNYCVLLKLITSLETSMGRLMM